MYEFEHSIYQKRKNMRAFPIETSAYFLTIPGYPYNSLLSLSQLGRGRILMPDTSPMAMNSVRVDEPP